MEKVKLYELVAKNREHRDVRKLCDLLGVSRLMKESGVSASTKALYVWNPGRNEFYTVAGNVLANE